MLFPLPDTVASRINEADVLTASLPCDDYHAFLSINESHSDDGETLATLSLDFTAESGETLRAALRRSLESLLASAKGGAA